MFYNRHDAAVQLVERLDKYKDDQCVVMAIPRGGIPVGQLIANRLNCPFEVFLSKKVVHPYNREFAIGSVSLYGTILEDDIGDIDPGYLHREKHEITKLLEETHRFYTGGKKLADLKENRVIIVDDGISTGNTIQTAIKIIKKAHPKKIVLAIPVCPANVAKGLTALADEFICLLFPDQVTDLGEFYHEFQQVKDEEVVELMTDIKATKN